MSHQLWCSIEHLFGSQSKAKIMQLKVQFQTTKNESMSMIAYFTKPVIADSLIMVGFHVTQLLAGLPLEYDAIIANINSSCMALDIEEIQSLLLN